MAYNDRSDPVDAELFIEFMQKSLNLRPDQVVERLQKNSSEVLLTKSTENNPPQWFANSTMERYLKSEQASPYGKLVRQEESAAKDKNADKSFGKSKSLPGGDTGMLKTTENWSEDEDKEDNVPRSPKRRREQEVAARVDDELHGQTPEDDINMSPRSFYRSFGTSVNNLDEISNSMMESFVGYRSKKA